MNRIFWILALALYPAIASATNFDACVNEAKTNHTDTAPEGAGFVAYKCEGTTAEKLSARPDECTEGGGERPPLRGLIRKPQQLDDGLFSLLTWRAGKCSGSCETRSYDSKDATHLCEVRIYTNGPAPPTDVIGEPAPRNGDGTDTATALPGPSPDGRLRRRRLVRPDRWQPPPWRYTYDRPMWREPPVREDRLYPPRPIPYRYDGGYFVRPLPPEPPGPPWCDC